MTVYLVQCEYNMHLIARNLCTLLPQEVISICFRWNSSSLKLLITRVIIIYFYFISILEFHKRDTVSANNFSCRNPSHWEIYIAFKSVASSAFVVTNASILQLMVCFLAQEPVRKGWVQITLGPRECAYQVSVKVYCFACGLSR